MFFDINKTLCEVFPGLDPIKLLDYPAVDVFDLINGLMSHTERSNKKKKKNGGTIRKPAGDNWF